MAGWFFQLQGEIVDLEQLATLFEPGALRVTRQGGEFWMQSADVDALTNPQEAREAAESALKTLNGISAFRVEGTGRVSLGRAEYLDASGRRNTFVFLQGIRSTMRMGIPSILINGEPVRPREDPMLTVALRNPDVDQVLRLYGSREPDWRDLYFILTVVETEIGVTVAKKGWISDAERTRFRRTANSKRAIGDLSRHGEDYEPPDRPIPLHDARRLITEVVERWIQEKL